MNLTQQGELLHNCHKLRRGLWSAVVAALLLPLLLGAAPAGGGRLIGMHAGWGSFAGPARCYAVARPLDQRGRHKSSGAAGVLFARPTGPPRLVIRLSAAPGPAREARLSVGEQRWALPVRGDLAYGTGQRIDRAILGAMRSAQSMIVTSVGPGGQPIIDAYPLAGAPSAIDAAAIACAR